MPIWNWVATGRAVEYYAPEGQELNVGTVRFNLNMAEKLMTMGKI